MMEKLGGALAAAIAMLLLAGCGQQETGAAKANSGDRAAGAAGSPAAPARPLDEEPVPSDEMIVCPGHSACPSDPNGVRRADGRGGKVIGVVVPQAQRGQDIYCPQDGAGTTADCPRGYYGRLWVAPPETVQIYCPNPKQSLNAKCPRNFIGWVCLRQNGKPPTECPGRPKTRGQDAGEDVDN
jgi:hypothetical protein